MYLRLCVREAELRRWRRVRSTDQRGEWSHPGPAGDTPISMDYSLCCHTVFPAEMLNCAAMSDSIPEFIRDLGKSTDIEGLWHYIPRLDAETEKPILTADGQPDRRDFAWTEIFPNGTGRVEIEIGSGKGGFMIDYAKKHPDCSLLGSEWDASWAHYAAQRLVKHKVTDNATMLRSDIFYFLRDRVPEGSVDAFHMYFPDPWPKKRHHKNRLLRPDFLAQVARCLKPGKRIFYWGTDHAEYNEVAQEIFAATPNLKVIEKNTAAPTDGIMTNFEKKYRKEGRPIYRSVLEFSK